MSHDGRPTNEVLSCSQQVPVSLASARGFLPNIAEPCSCQATADHATSCCMRLTPLVSSNKACGVVSGLASSTCQHLQPDSQQMAA